MKKRVLAASMATVLALGMLAGCGSSDSGKTTAAGKEETKGNTAETTAAAPSGEKVSLGLYWWGNQKRNEVTAKAVELYTSKNPNVEIKMEFAEWGSYWDKLAAMTTGGNMPDIIQMDYSYLAQYQGSGHLADLTPYIKDGTFNTEKIPQSIIEAGSIDGKCYAISLGSNAIATIYDKGVLDELGLTMPEQPTYDELYELTKKVYEEKGIPGYLDGGINGIMMVARSYGSNMFEELKSGKSDSTKKLFDLVEKFQADGYCMSPDILAEKNPDTIETKPLLDGTTWIDFSFSNQYITIVGQAGRDLGICMYPQVADATKQNMFLKPSQFFSVAETSKNKEEAVKFLNWFTNDVDCNLILMGERGIPINTDVSAALKEKVDDVTKIVYEYVAKVAEVGEPIDPPDPAGKGEIEANGKTLVEDVRFGDKTGAQAADEYVKMAQEILNKK